MRVQSLDNEEVKEHIGKGLHIYDASMQQCLVEANQELAVDWRAQESAQE
ncbi:hypothetical protein HPP92_027587 [Vanilla planifolia]|uniref:Uncharacterized protein n=1 Tax=Vanilla planifolia TaxID=51239 RepID=A0A835U5T4_VANPL|nr:hypothetical protein HPP92_027587 [Vanilla planifolia]